MSRKLFITMLFLMLAPAFLLDGFAGSLRIMTYNIHHAEGTDGVIDYHRMARVIKGMDADIVALQEVDNKAGRTNEVNQVAELAALCGYEHFVFGRSMPLQGGEYGLAVMSRYPITGHEVHPLPFRFGLEPRTMLLARIEIGSESRIITLGNTHLCHQSEENRIDQVRRINSILKSEEGPVFLAGDFNARKDNDSMRLMWSRNWQDLSSKHSRIDYILGREKDLCKVVDSRMIEDRVTSDHFPIVVEVSFPE